MGQDLSIEGRGGITVKGVKEGKEERRKSKFKGEGREAEFFPKGEGRGGRGNTVKGVKKRVEGGRRDCEGKGQKQIQDFSGKKQTTLSLV